MDNRTRGDRRLRLVNSMLRSLSESRIHDLDTNYPVVQDCLDVIEESVDDLCSVGWWFNTVSKTLHRNQANDVIEAPENMTGVIEAVPSTITVFNGIVWDTRTDTPYEGDSVTVVYTFIAELEDIPTKAFAYIREDCRYRLIRDFDRAQGSVEEAYMAKERLLDELYGLNLNKHYMDVNRYPDGDEMLDTIDVAGVRN